MTSSFWFINSVCVVSGLFFCCCWIELLVSSVVELSSVEYDGCGNRNPGIFSR